MRGTREAANVYDLSARWWVLVVRGIAAILFGILTLALPEVSLLALIVAWGAYALFDGLVHLLLAGSAARGRERRGWLLVDGILGIAAGLTAFVWPGVTGMTLLFVIACWAVLSGVVAIALAVELRRIVEHEWLLALSGVLSIGLGVLLVVHPGAGALAVVGLIAAYAIVEGVVLVALGALLADWRRVDETTFSRGAL